MTIAELNALDEDAFTESLGFAFEHSSWIAREAWARRPFRGVDQLHEAMLAVLEAAPEERRVALIAAHPDLAGRVAREGRLTPESAGEQRSAGLDRLTSEEAAHFESMNAAYRSRFGFPFVICAREHDKHSILAAMEARLNSGREAEIRTALSEIGKIARLRLSEAVTA